MKQNGVGERHNSVDNLMGLLNEMGKSSRQRSLSDGDGTHDGKFNQ